MLRVKVTLKKPSLHLENLLSRIEGIIRSNDHGIFHHKFVESTIEQMLSERIEGDFEGEGSHEIEHATVIIRLFTLLYLQIRLHYAATLVTKIDKQIRRVFTKLISFKNQ